MGAYSGAKKIGPRASWLTRIKDRFHTPYLHIPEFNHDQISDPDLLETTRKRFFKNLKKDCHAIKSEPINFVLPQNKKTE